MATDLVPDKDFLGAAFGLLGVDGPAGRDHLFLVALKGICDKRHISIAEKKLGERQILEARKECLMHIQGEAVAGVPYKGGRALGGVGRVKIDEIVATHS